MDEPRRLLDGTLGDWVNDRLVTIRPGVPVGALVPTGFARVVRVLHPLEDGTTWAQVARTHGQATHPTVWWPDIAPHFDISMRGPDDPLAGSAPAAMLAAVLEHCPADDEVVYGVWDGFGSWVEQPEESTLMPGWGGRSYLLFAGAKAAWTAWPGMDDPCDQSANWIWPTDHTWCIGTDIDWDSTFVACSETVAEGLLGDERLETFSVGYDDELVPRGHPRP